MSRDKQIEEMAKTLCEDYGECGKCSLSKPECENPCFVRDDCEKLYNAGYRKASEVIDEFIKAMIDEFGVNQWDRMNIDVRDLAELKKKYESEGADDEAQAD